MKFLDETGIPESSPAADWMLQVREEEGPKPLPEEKTQDFHHIVTQLMFFSARVRRDIHIAMYFLTTRYKSPDEDDWGKLKRVLRYLKGNKYMKSLCMLTPCQ